MNPSKPIAPVTPIRTHAIYWILVAQALVILPLLWRLPQWLWGLWVLTLFWRYALQKNWVQRTAGVLKWILAISAIAGWFVSFPHRTNTDAMVGLLVMSFILKTIECHSHKDGLLLIYIGFIAVAGQFLFNQSLSAGLYGAFCLGALLIAWYSLYFGRARSIVERLRYGSVLLIQAIPLFVLLFVVMPRLSPLWKVPMPEGKGKTGFSERLSPGDLSNLVKSGDTAFRATFIGQQPATKELYWRGLVLTSFDGRTWTRTPDDLEIQEEATVSFEDLIEYSIVVEPHFQSWLFALATPVKVAGTGLQVKKHVEGLIKADANVFQRTQYQVTSARKVYYQDNSQLSSQELRLNLAIPSVGNVQTQALAAMWVRAGMDTQQKIIAALGMFQKDFSYTLSPPKLGDDVIDDFLFFSKRGFCEHFASSFAYLMRAAEVPARVVVGYLGGTYNNPNSYLVVSQADAHAWVEIWQQGFGWVAIDPTAAVAPNRIEFGIDEALNQEERALVGQGVISANNWLAPWQKRWDAANFAWQRWVLNYDNEKQKNILEQWLGGSDWQSVLKALAIICALLAILFALWLLRLQIKPKLSAQAQILVPLLRKLKKRGFHLAQDESVMALLHRVGEQRAEYKIPARHLAQLVERAVYAEDPAATKKLQHAIRKFPRVHRK